MFSNCSCLQSDRIAKLEQEIKEEEVRVQTTAGELVKIITIVEF